MAKHETSLIERTKQRLLGHHPVGVPPVSSEPTTVTKQEAEEGVRKALREGKPPSQKPGSFRDRLRAAQAKGARVTSTTVTIEQGGKQLVKNISSKEANVVVGIERAVGRGRPKRRDDVELVRFQTNIDSKTYDMFTSVRDDLNALSHTEALRMMVRLTRWYIDRRAEGSRVIATSDDPARPAREFDIG